VALPEGLDVNPQVNTEPATWGEGWSAAMNLENDVVNAMYWFDKRDFGDADPEHNPWNSIVGTELEPFADSFLRSRNDRETEYIASRIRQELKWRKDLERSGTWGIVAPMIASILSPTTLIPGGQLVRGANAARAAFRSAITVGGANVAAAGIQEGVLQSTQYTRTALETGMNLIFAGALGGALGGLMSGASSVALRRQMAAAADLDVKGLTEAAVDARLRQMGITPGGLAAENLSAARVKNAPLELEPSFGMAEFVGQKLPSWLSDPGTRFATSSARSARELYGTLVDPVLAATRNRDFIPTAVRGGTIETRLKVLGNAREGRAVKAVDDQWVEMVKRMTGRGGATRARLPGKTLSGLDNVPTPREFREMVSQAMRRGDDHPIPEVAKAAKEFRALLIDPIANEAVALSVLRAEVVGKSRPKGGLSANPAGKLSATASQSGNAAAPPRLQDPLQRNMIGDLVDRLSANIGGKGMTAAERDALIDLLGDDPVLLRQLQDILRGADEPMFAVNPETGRLVRPDGEMIGQSWDDVVYDLMDGKIVKVDDQVQMRLIDDLMMVDEMLPKQLQDIPKFIMTKAQPTGSGFRFTFRNLFGEVRDYTLSLGQIASGLRAFHMDGEIFILRSGIGDKVGGINSPELLFGQIWHESTHAAFDRLLVGQHSVEGIKRLAAHAENLRVLDIQYNEFLRYVGDPTWRTADDRTIREVYEDLYANYPDMEARVHEEAVAHMMELRAAGHWTDNLELAPIADDIKALFGENPAGLGAGREDPMFAVGGMRALLGAEPSPVSGIDNLPGSRGFDRQALDEFSEVRRAKEAFARAGRDESFARDQALTDLRAGIPVSVRPDTLLALRTFLDGFDFPPGLRVQAVGSLRPIDTRLVEVGLISDIRQGNVGERVILDRERLFDSQALVSRDGNGVLVFRLAGLENGDHGLRGQLAHVMAESAVLRGSIDGEALTRLQGLVQAIDPLNQKVGRYARERGEVVNARFEDATLRDVYMRQFEGDEKAEQIIFAKAVGHLAERAASGRMMASELQAVGDLMAMLPMSASPMFASGGRVAKDVVLYRGEPANASGGLGHHFTRSFDRAKGFAGPDGKVFAVRVPIERMGELRSSRDPFNYVVPADIRAGMSEVDSPQDMGMMFASGGQRANSSNSAEFLENEMNKAISDLKALGVDWETNKYRTVDYFKHKVNQAAADIVSKIQRLQRELSDAEVQEAVGSSEFKSAMQNKLRSAKVTTVIGYHGSPAAGEIASSGRFAMPDRSSMEMGEGIYFAPDPEQSNRYAMAYGSEGRRGEDGATPGTIKVRLTGRFLNESDIADFMEFKESRLGGRVRIDRHHILAEARRQGFDGATQGTQYVVFPEAQGRGVIKSATSDNMMFAAGGRSPLLTAIRQLGGIKDTTGDLKAMEPPRGIINNKSGLEPDKMREALMQRGLLSQADMIENGQARQTVDDLYEAVRDAIFGRDIPNRVDPQEEAAYIVSAARDLFESTMGTRLNLDEADEAYLVNLVQKQGFSLEDAIEEAIARIRSPRADGAAPGAAGGIDLKQAMDAYNALVRDYGQYLRGQGIEPGQFGGVAKALDELAGREGFAEEAANRINQLREAQASMDEARQAAHGRMPEELQQRMRKLMGDMQERLKSSGGGDDGFSPEVADQVWDDGGQSYLTRIYRQDRIKAKRGDFKSILVEYFSQSQQRAQRLLAKLEKSFNPETAKPAEVKNIEDLRAFTGLDRAALTDQADKVIDNILGHDPTRMSFDLPAGVQGPLKARTLRIPDTFVHGDLKFEDFLESDINMIARYYNRTVTPQVEIMRMFGDLDASEYRSKINDEYNALIDRAPDEKTRIRLDGERRQVLEDLQISLDRLQGKYGMPENHDAFGPRAGRVMKNLVYMTSLGGMTVNALTDTFRPMMVHGLGTFYSDGLGSLASALANLDRSALKAAGQEVFDAGTALEMVFPRGMAIADVMDDYGRHSKFERGVGWAADRFGYLALMNQWNSMLKQWTGVMVMNKILKATQRVAEGRATDMDRMALARSGIDEFDARLIAQQFEKHGRVDKGVYIANTREWDFDDAVNGVNIKNAMESFRSAIANDIDRTIVTPGLDRPHWMSHWVGSLIGQLKSFAFASVPRTLLAGLQQRDAGVLFGAAGMVALGMVVETLKSYMNDKPTPQTLPQWIVAGVDRSGLTGWLFEANNMLEKVSGGTVGMGPATGKPLSRYASRNIMDALIGPSAGRIGDAVWAISGISRELAGKGNLTESELSALRRSIPGQNLFYLAYVFQQAQTALQESMGIPRTNRGQAFDRDNMVESFTRLSTP